MDVPASITNSADTDKTVTIIIIIYFVCTLPQICNTFG
jgi:hypothetical protein